MVNASHWQFAAQYTSAVLKLFYVVKPEQTNQQKANRLVCIKAFILFFNLCFYSMNIAWCVYNEIVNFAELDIY